MKTSVAFLLCVFATFNSFASSGQGASPMISPDGVPLSPYQANELTPYPIPCDAVRLDGPNSAASCIKMLPRSYKPFYISHYGRHGSRTDNSASRFLGLVTTFDKVSEAGLLTAQGDSIYSLLKKENEYADGRLGYLTPLGVEQHKGIALRMADAFPQVFAGKAAKIDCRATKYPRCILSMTSFVSALNSRFPSLDLEMEASERMSQQLNNPNPQHYADSIEFVYNTSLASMKSDTTTALAAIFTDVDSARKYFGSASSVFNSLYYAAGMGLNIPLEVELFHFFKTDVLEEILKINNDFIYLKNCDGKRWGSVCIRKVDSLLAEFVERADNAIAGKGYAADLRFGHDGAFMSLLDRFDVPGIPEGLAEDDIHDFYVASLVPMAANLQLIFFRTGKSSDDILVLCLCNEEAFVPCGLSPVYDKFCRWSDLKKRLL